MRLLGRSSVNQYQSCIRLKRPAKTWLCYVSHRLHVDHMAHTTCLWIESLFLSSPFAVLGHSADGRDAEGFKNPLVKIAQETPHSKGESSENTSHFGSTGFTQGQHVGGGAGGSRRNSFYSLSGFSACHFS